MTDLGRPPIKVLHIDDSLIVRQALKLFLRKSDGVQINLESCSSGESGLKKMVAFEPDIIVLDVEMPSMNGIETLKHIRDFNQRLPVLMFSSLTTQGAKVTVEALVNGATDYLAKPSSLNDGGGIDSIESQVLKKVIYWATLYQKNNRNITPTPKRQIQPVLGSLQQAPKLERKSFTNLIRPLIGVNTAYTNPVDAICIGTSTGGPMALTELCKRLQLDDHPPILIVQHMPPKFTKELADKLNSITSSTVIEARDDEEVKRACIYIAPGGIHMALKKTALGVKIKLLNTEPINSCKPSVDILFKSASDMYGRRLLAVMLTGMGSDGLLGTAHIKARGGRVIAQDEASSIVWGMPGAVVRNNLADMVLDVAGITHQLQMLSKNILAN